MLTRNLTGEDYCQDCEQSGFWWNGDLGREPCGNCEKGQQVKVWWIPPWMKYQKEIQLDPQAPLVREADRRPQVRR